MLNGGGPLGKGRTFKIASDLSENKIAQQRTFSVAIANIYR